jgi:2'-5' RNA ligase
MNLRLFTGIAIEPAVLDRIADAVAKLRPQAKIKWSPVENLHITTKFVGTWPEERLPELQSALAAVERRGPFAIRVARFGYYPNPHRPRVFFAGVNGGDALAGLASRIDEALSVIGCAREEKPYSPHLTLARIKDEDIRALREQIASMTDFEFGTFTAREFHLYLSKPGAHGSVYTVLSSYPLRGAAPQGEHRA